MPDFLAERIGHRLPGQRFHAGARGPVRHVVAQRTRGHGPQALGHAGGPVIGQPVIGVQAAIDDAQQFQDRVGKISVPPARSKADLAEQIDLRLVPARQFLQGAKETLVVPGCAVVVDDLVPERFILTRSMEPSVMAASISAKWKGSPPKRREEFIFYLRVFRRLGEIVARGLVIDGRLAQVVDNGADGGLRPGVWKNPHIGFHAHLFKIMKERLGRYRESHASKFADNPIAWAPQLLRVQTAANAIGSLEHHGMQAHAHQLIGAHHSGHPGAHDQDLLAIMDIGNTAQGVPARLAQEFSIFKGKVRDKRRDILVHPQGRSEGTRGYGGHCIFLEIDNGSTDAGISPAA